MAPANEMEPHDEMSPAKMASEVNSAIADDSRVCFIYQTFEAPAYQTLPRTILVLPVSIPRYANSLSAPERRATHWQL